LLRPGGHKMSLATALEPLLMREVLGSFPTGVTAIAGLVDGEPLGLAANSFTSVSLEPPLVLVCIGRSSSTWPELARATMLGISVLSANQGHACRQLGGPRERRFTGLDWRATPDGAVLLDGGSAWLECSVERQWPAGDHDIVLLRVHSLWDDRSEPPLVFYRSRTRRIEELEGAEQAS